MQTQLDEAFLERARINKEWNSFQARNESVLLVAEIESQKSLQQNYINRRNSLEILQYDIQGLKAQIEQDPSNENILSDLTLYVLQNRAFGTAGNIQLEINSFESFSASSFSERVEQLSNLEMAASSQLDELDELINEIDPTVLSLQEEISKLSTEKAELDTERSIILNTYDTLAKKVAEGEIEQNDTTGKAQIVSRAIAPVVPEPRGRVTTSAIAAIAVAAIATFVILALTWWNEEYDGNQSVEAKVNHPRQNQFSNGIDKTSESAELSVNE